MFYYCLDYIYENSDTVRKVLVRPALEAEIKRLLPKMDVVSCSVGRYLFEAFLANQRNDLLYTPTPHPLPYINNQLIVIHDVFPFYVGRLSTLKRFLLRISLLLSRCKVGYINRSDVLPFITNFGIATSRMIFTPNRFPEPFERFQRKLQDPSCSAILTVGLFGTDSAKKNYECLFNVLKQNNLSSCFIFRVYGHDNTYFQSLCAKFSEFRILLSKSDKEGLNVFLSRVDIVASVAEGEGFGRPIAAALLAGVPVKLLDHPVFREFFNGGAHFYLDIDDLVQSLREFDLNDTYPAFTAPAEFVDAYVDAKIIIHQAAQLSV